MFKKLLFAMLVFTSLQSKAQVSKEATFQFINEVFKEMVGRKVAVDAPRGYTEVIQEYFGVVFEEKDGQVVINEYITQKWVDNDDNISYKKRKLVSNMIEWDGLESVESSYDKVTLKFKKAYMFTANGEASRENGMVFWVPYERVESFKKAIRRLAEIYKGAGIKDPFAN